MGIEDILKKTNKKLSKPTKKNPFSFGHDIPAVATEAGSGDAKLWIPCPVFPLNCALGGGLSLGRISEVYSDHEGDGKAQPLDAKVLTPTGFVPIGSLHVGDYVIGSNGKPTHVKGVYPQGKKEIFKVTTSDGGETKCCGDHLWFTQNYRERARKDKGSIKTTFEIKESIKVGIKGRSNELNHQLPIVSSVSFTDERDSLPIDPYLLGVILGDGTIYEKSVLIHNPEEDILEKTSCKLPEEDYAVFFDYKSRCSGIRIKRKKRNNRKSETLRFLTESSLNGMGSKEKFIPEEYLFSSISNRIELLRGLCDTDGNVMKRGNCVEFSTSSSRLSDDFAFLARSLGGIVATTSRIPHYTYKGERKKGSVSYRITLKFPNGIVPVSSKKHLEIWNGRKAHHFNFRKIKKVEPVGEEECVCISVENSDGLYVTDDFILTHNTTLSLLFAAVVQSVGGTVVWYESESALDKPRACAMGVKLDELIKWTPDTLEDGFRYLRELIKTIREDPEKGGKPVLFVWDTISMARTEGERDGDPFKDGVMAGPRTISTALKNYSQELTANNVHLMLVNQSYTKMASGRSSYLGPQYETPGGKRIKFAASYRIKCKKRGYIGRNRTVKPEDEKLGIVANITITKNKLAVPYRSLDLCLYGNTGYSDIMTMARLFAEDGVYKWPEGLATLGVGRYRPIGLEKSVYWYDLEKAVLDNPKTLDAWRQRWLQIFPIHESRKPRSDGWYELVEGADVSNPVPNGILSGGKF